jgi:alkylation response protein AidB-like acyl-CoA dehydrogenase
MGIEAPSIYNGANSTFFTSILAIEELSKVDGNIGLLVDLQNTIMMPLLLNYGSDYIKETYVPKFTSETVKASFCLHFDYCYFIPS